MNRLKSHTSERDAQMQEAAAEAGPGADNTNAVPLYAIKSRSGRDDSNVPSSNASTQVPLEEEIIAQPKGVEAATHGPATNVPDFETRSTAKKAIIMTALGIAVFLAALDVTIITTALPTIAEHFHSSSGYTWIGSAYLLGNASSTPSWGKISDIFGRKPVLMMANVIFMVGSLVAALSNSIGMLIAARAVQGLGGGGLVTLVNICISDLFSLRSRGAYFGIIGGVWAVAGAIGPVIGGLFTEKVSWRWCFYINLPLDGAAFLIILFLLDLKTPRTPIVAGLKAIDWSGSLLVVGGTLMFLFGLEYGGVTYPWDSPIVLCLLIFGVFTIGLFGINEWKVAIYPVMPLRLFEDSSNVACYMCAAMHGMVFIAGSYFLPLFFQAVRGATPILSGVYILPTAVSLSISSICTGIFIRKTGKYLPCIYFGFFCMTVGSGLFCDFYVNSSWAKLVLFQGVCGLGIGPLFQAPLIALQSRIHPRDIATATATFGFVRNIATSIAVVIGGVVYQNQMLSRSAVLVASLGPEVAQELAGSGAGANVRVIDALPPAERLVARTAFANSMHPMWIMFCCISAVGLLISLFIKKKVLTKEHKEMKTGLEAEKENKAARIREKAERKSVGQRPKSVDLESATVVEKHAT